ncbi:MAG: hypothetical protein AAF539_13020, partial [Planctomycetota bacterium]
MNSSHDCEHFDRELNECIDAGDVSDFLTPERRAHMQICPRCQSTWQTWNQIDSALQSQTEQRSINVNQIAHCWQPWITVAAAAALLLMIALPIQSTRIVLIQTNQNAKQKVSRLPNANL